MDDDLERTRLALLRLLRSMGLHPFARLFGPKEQPKPLLLSEGSQGAEASVVDPEESAPPDEQV